MNASICSLLAILVCLLTACDERRGPAVAEAGPAVVVPRSPDADVAALLQRLARAARDDPESGERAGRLGMAYEINGFPDAALASYARAESLDSEDFLWPYYRALLLGREGRYADAVGALDRAIGIDGSYAPAWLWRGTWMLGQGRPDEGATAFRRAGELGAGYWASIGLARARMQQGDHAAAIPHLERIPSGRRQPYVHRLLGRAYRALGRLDDSRVAFALGRKEDPFVWPDPRTDGKHEYTVSFGGRMTYAEQLLAAGRVKEALAILESLRARRPDDRTLISILGVAYGQAGRPERARAVLARGLEIHPDDYYLRYYLATLHHEMGNSDLALRHLERAIEAIPDRGEGYERLADILLAQGRDREALPALDKALAFGVSDPDRVLFKAGRVEMNREAWGQAAERFSRAVDINVANPLAHLHLARCLAEAGRLEEANAALEWPELLGGYQGELAAVRARIATLGGGASR